MTPTLPSPPPAVSQEQNNPIVKVAVAFWLLEFFLVYSRFFDSVAGGMHIPTVILGCLLLTSLMSGLLFRGLRSKIGRILVAFFCWVPVTMVFSIWRSGSIPTFWILFGSVLGFLWSSGLLSSIRHVRQTLYTLAISSLVASVLGHFFGGLTSGRLEVMTGTYKDANAYAMCLLMGVPFWLLMAGATRSPFLKIFSLACLLPIFWAFFNTGSRGGLLGLAALVVMLMAQASLARKVVIFVVTIVGILAVGAMMPSYLKTRYLSTVGDVPDSSQMTAEERAYLEADIGSMNGRKNMLMRSIEVTFEYPLFGVGPGNFPVALFVEAKQQGKNFGWVVTHNAYTQISSETGIPGLILYLLLAIYTFKEMNGIRRLTGPRGPCPWPEAYNCANSMRLSATTVSVCLFFLSMGFDPAIYVLAGISVSLRRVVDNEMAARGAAGQAAVPVPLKAPAMAPQLAGLRSAGFRPMPVTSPVHNRFQGSL